MFLLLPLFLVSCVCAPVGSKVKIYAYRLTPGQDLRRQLLALTTKDGLKAASIVSGVGSLRYVTIRFADQKEGTRIEGPLEIVSLIGTISKDGPHLHISVADSKGHVYGGHLMEGSEIYTTAELTLAEALDLSFVRKLDPQTGYDELSIAR